MSKSILVWRFLGCCLIHIGLFYIWFPHSFFLLMFLLAPSLVSDSKVPPWMILWGEVLQNGGHEPANVFWHKSSLLTRAVVRTSMRSCPWVSTTWASKVEQDQAVVGGGRGSVCVWETENMPIEKILPSFNNLPGLWESNISSHRQGGWKNKVGADLRGSVASICPCWSRNKGSECPWGAVHC